MIGIIHCADIHLSIKEKDYSFSVLDEIVSLTNENNCRYLIFAGDIFDSYSDLEKLRFDFRKSLGGLDPHVRVLFIAGNHEEIGGKSADIPKFILSDNANFFMPDDNRIKFIRDAEVEFILMPFRKNRSEPQESVIPEKKSFRIAVAHGMVPGMSYNGIDDEAVSGCIDPYIFVKYRIDYAALGHLHSKNGKPSKA